MFQLFSRASSEALRACEMLAMGASIEPVLEGCSCIGFVVQLQDADFERYFKYNNTVDAFMRIVEKRIAEQDFARLYIHPASSELDTAGVPRVVFDKRGRVLFNW